MLHRSIRLELAVPLALCSTFVVAQEHEPVIEEIVVTAQKRQESIQDVPIAVSAFTAESLAAQRIEGARDLQLAVPNMNYSRPGLGADNFQIRGIGQHVFSVAGDAGVGIHQNNTPLAFSRVADVDFYDVQRVEVLRGPQGTLYGRNSTGGVVNVITMMPQDEFAASASLDIGNYDNRKLYGFVNMPAGERFAARLAGLWLDRDGYSTDLTTNDDVDGRELWSTRLTLSFKPTDTISTFLLWERFEEDDDRTAGLKTICAKDLGPTSVGGVPTNGGGNPFLATQAFLSRGCMSTTVYDPAGRTGSVNSVGTLGGVIAMSAGLQLGDAYAGAFQPADMRTVEFSERPRYEAKDDFIQLGIEIDLTDYLKLTSLTAYADDDLYIRADGSSVQPSVPFLASPLAPGGLVNQPQVGSHDRLQSINAAYLYAKQRVQELRLQSSFGEAIDFSVGGIYMKHERMNEIYVFVNSETAFAQLDPRIYTDPLPRPDRTGHSYFLSLNPYELEAKAVFGELYWNALDTVRVTFGLRYTDDKKQTENYPVTLLAPGRGWPFVDTNGVTQTVKPQEVRFKETTGRLNIDWEISDNSRVYASYSKGYKGGGFNSPDIVAGSQTFEPEFVNAYEIGSKNFFLDRSLLLNVTAFLYDYDDYQISKISGFASITENVDARIHGVELETVWEPTDELRLNASIGYLDTEIRGGSAVDPYDRTQGNPALTLLKSTTSACVGETAQVATLIALINAGFAPPNAVLGACPTALAPNGPFSGPAPNNPFAPAGLNLVTSDGVPVDLEGKELPTSPDLTASFGAQYTWYVGDWSLTARGDYFYQSDSHATLFNNRWDRLKAWDNVNATITFDHEALGLRVQAYGRNLLDETIVNAAPVQSDALGLVRQTVLLDPRLYGIVLTKRF